MRLILLSILVLVAPLALAGSPGLYPDASGEGSTQDGRLHCDRTDILSASVSRDSRGDFDVRLRIADASARCDVDGRTYTYRVGYSALDHRGERVYCASTVWVDVENERTDTTTCTGSGWWSTGGGAPIQDDTVRFLIPGDIAPRDIWFQAFSDVCVPVACLTGLYGDRLPDRGVIASWD